MTRSRPPRALPRRYRRVLVLGLFVLMWFELYVGVELAQLRHSVGTLILAAAVAVFMVAAYAVATYRTRPTAPRPTAPCGSCGGYGCTFCGSTGWL